MVLKTNKLVEKHDIYLILAERKPSFITNITLCNGVLILPERFRKGVQSLSTLIVLPFSCCL